MNVDTEQAIPSAPTIRPDIQRVSPDVVEAARRSSSSSLHEAAGRIGAMPSLIKPVTVGQHVCGPAVTVQLPAGDNLWLHRALYVAQPADVLVVHVGGAFDFGYWGEIMSTAARARNLGGLVIDGCVRDGATLGAIGFPVFARGLCIRGSGKDFSARGWINFPIMFDDTVVNPGDLVVGDVDGVVVLPRVRSANIVHAALQRDAQEADILRQINMGARTLEVYNL